VSIPRAGAPAAVSNAFPPYELYELPPEVGKIPPHRSDAGAFLLADAYGAARTIYVKDVDGVMTSDPAGEGGDAAELIERVSVDELLALDLPSLPIDPVVLDLMTRAKHQKEIQIVNGLKPENIARALRGEPVGTIVHV
jgi:molybdenum storage protein